ncbi:MAG: hypothetical protein II887_08215 [Bacteroidales bacterium]|nr:hypothetical protein [Bacteroidales bacterium]
MKKRVLLVISAMLLVVVVVFFIHQHINCHFRPMTNFDCGRTVSLDMDLENAVTEGINIPSTKQTKEGDGMFHFRFIAPKKGMFYKIYYQNESYKFPDTSAYAAENFYGSWEDVNIGFKPVDGKVVRDALRIVGNPRDERIYYGSVATEEWGTKTSIETNVQNIRNDKQWYDAIVEKAAGNHISIEDQIFIDAVWMAGIDLNKDAVNHRWKRNPRAGEYAFMLVLCDEEGLAEIPDYIQYIGRADENGRFVNPFGWYEMHPSKHIRICKSGRVLKTRAVLDGRQGLNCGEDKTPQALYEQFFSHISTQYTLRNIPVIKDVVGEDPYTREEYESNRARFDSTQLIMDYPVVSKQPGTTVKVSPDGSYITLINPASTEGNLRKESTGIRTRVGFTYGKYRGKIKFPVMLNEENLWNGLTYAFWLIYADGGVWNQRRPNFAGGGYIPKWDDTEHPQRTPYHPYSEIDIEIVKASKHWPWEYYRWSRGDRENCEEDATLNNDVMFCCTNWDLASTEPPKFKGGLDTIPYDKNHSFEVMRWYPNYKALTSRTPMPNSAFKEDWYYYEIEWRPTEIIWRLGPDPDHMKVMGYIDDQHSSIPNNQMKCIVTQEYHYSEWWPPIVWEQGLIPYNKTDIEGRVYEIIVE